MTNPLKWWQRVIVYAMMGWCIELAFTGISSFVAGDPKLSAITYLWMLPFWGFGVLACEVLIFAMDVINLGMRMRLVLFMLIAFSMEYVAGFTIKSIVGIIPWDYSSSIWSVDNYIRLDYAPFWALSGMFLEPFIGFVKRIEIRSNKKPFIRGFEGVQNEMVDNSSSDDSGV